MPATITMIFLFGAFNSTFAQTRTMAIAPTLGFAGGSESAALMVLAVAVIVILGLIVLCVWAVTTGIKRGKDRTVQLEKLAGQWRFSFQKKPFVPLFLQNTVFAETSPLAQGGGMNNLLQGVIDDLPVFVFDFGRTTVSGIAPMRLTHTTRQTVFCVPRKGRAPFAYFNENQIVAPENLKQFINSGLAAFRQNN